MEQNLKGKKLFRSRKDKVIAGVAGGLGEYFNVDPLIFRIIFITLLFGGGSGLIIYLILAVLIPLEPLAGSSGDQAAKEGQSGNVSDKAADFANEVREGVQNLAREIKEDSQKNSNRARDMIGAVIVGLGILLLLGEFFPGRWFRWDLFWPAVIILAGVAILTSRRK